MHPLVAGIDWIDRACAPAFRRGAVLEENHSGWNKYPAQTLAHASMERARHVAIREQCLLLPVKLKLDEHPSKVLATRLRRLLSDPAFAGSQRFSDPADATRAAAPPFPRGGTLKLP
ncbi:hypothetical protein [Caballeronia glathei]|uniref:hypothetical protein n=1 Tax=Caballeronia glathei TaxID=60547 RepID=UPI00101A09CC|nr:MULTISPECIES: hypothetical protein [Burkholderiaceae]